MIERRRIVDRAEWLEWRKPYVTASQVPALFGCHPYLSALKLYLEKQGIEFPEKDNDPVLRRGRLLEPVVAMAAAELRPKWQIEPAGEFFSDSFIRVGATPDFFISGDPRGLGVLQAKTAAPAIYERDWNGGTVVPFWVTLQVLTEMMLANAAFGAVAVINVDAYDLACSVHEVERHQAAENKIRGAVQQFWTHVEQGEQPQPDYGKDAALLKILSPREAVPDQSIDLSGDNELPSLLDERELLHAKAKADKTRCEEIETQLKFAMKDAAIATGLADWRITYRTTKYKGYTVEPRESRVLRIQRKGNAYG